MAKDRQGKMRYTGQTTWVNQDTGEIRVVDEFERPVGRTERFMITYLAEIINLIDNLGNKKMQVVKYILEKMDKSNNTLIITTRELATKAGVGHNTVLDTLKILEQAGLVKRRTGAIMVLPRLMNNKKAQGEATMMVRYREFNDSLQSTSVSEPKNASDWVQQADVDLEAEFREIMGMEEGA